MNHNGLFALLADADKFLKYCIAVSLLIASLSFAYFCLCQRYLIYNQSVHDIGVVIDKITGGRQYPEVQKSYSVFN